MKTIPETGDMTYRELLAELSAHGYTPADLAKIKNWTQAARLVEKLRRN